MNDLPNDITLESATFTFTQPEDCCGRINEEFQDLTIHTEDGGGGKYLVLSTERWAIDSIKDLECIFEKLYKILKE